MRRRAVRATRSLLPLAALALGACDDVMSPLRKLADVGKDPYLFFVADSPDGRSDIWVARPGGDAARQATYTPAWESAPSLSPDGAMLAFLRSADSGAAAPREAWVMNLITGRERQLQLPAMPSPVRRVGWSRDEQAIYLATDAGLWRVAAPPASGVAAPLPDAEHAAADSALHVFVGEPAFAEVVPCDVPADLCALAGGERKPLQAGASDPVRWGSDSVGYVLEGSLRVRPLGPGRERRVEFAPAVTRPRQVTYFPGARR